MNENCNIILYYNQTTESRTTNFPDLGAILTYNINFFLFTLDENMSSLSLYINI